MTHEIDTSLLPVTLQEMQQLIGTKATLLLVEKYGGVRFYVPKTMTPEHELAKLIGIKEAEKLVKNYGGATHEIPKALLASVAHRNIAIKQEYKDLSQRQLALKYGLTERQVRNIVCDEKQVGNQMELF